MSRLNLILLPSMLVLALPVWAEGRPANAKAAQSRPLNLSLPRDVLQAPGRDPVDETVERNLQAPPPTPKGATTLPYGAGYEHRHQDMGGTGTGMGAGAAASPGSGSGRRGR
jgi:hypothetical protein